MKKSFLAPILVFLCGFFYHSNAQIVTRLGGAYRGDGGPASSASLSPYKMQYINGKLFVYDYRGQIIKIENDRLYMEVGIRNTPCYHYDTGIAHASSPIGEHRGFECTGMAVDNNENIYFTSTNYILRKNNDGTLNVIGGNGLNSTPIADNIAATSVSLFDSSYGHPDIAVDNHGNLYCSDSWHHLIYKIDSNGILKIIAGVDSTANPDTIYNNAPALHTCLRNPGSLTFDSRGNLWGISNNRIFKLNTAGQLSSRIFPLGNYIQFGHDSLGNIFYIDSTVIYKMDSDFGVSIFRNLNTVPPTRVWGLYPCFVTNDSFLYAQRYFAISYDSSMIASSGSMSNPTPLYGVYGLYSKFEGWKFKDCNWEFSDYDITKEPYGMFVDHALNTFISKDASVIKIDSQNIISRVPIPQFNSMACDKKGNYYLLNYDKIYKSDLTSPPVLIAGSNSAVGIVDGVSATNTQLTKSYDGDIVVNSNGEIILNDVINIRKIDTNGIITHIAGQSYALNNGDNGPASTANIYARGLALGKDGSIYFSTLGIHSIRKISTNGIISTIAGGGTSLADSIPAIDAELGEINTIKVDSFDNIFLFGYRRGFQYISPDGILHRLTKCDSCELCFNDTVTDIHHISPVNAFWGALDDFGRVYMMESFQSSLFRMNALIKNTAPPDTFKTDTSFALQVYPNPTNGNLHVKYYTSTPGPVQMVIIDVAGRRLQTLETSTTTGIIDETIELPRGMQSGMYFLKLTTPTGGNGRKFMLQH